MNKTQELIAFENRILFLNRKEKAELLENSNLDDRELQLISYRFIQGLSLKECANILGLEINTISKNQTKIIKKITNILRKKKSIKNPQNFSFNSIFSFL